MMGRLKSFFWSAEEPAAPDKPTNDIAPAPRPAESEAQIKQARGQFVGELMRVERKVHEIRHELAGTALRIVAGER